MENNTRLIISRIIVHNFKSFYGTVELDQFHPQFTSIVGANGSGKSNVIDALRFVCGSKAKEVRQQKLAGLIHYSAAHPDLKESYVTIYFARVDDNHEIIPHTEFSIKRDLKSNGDNNFYMNNTKVKRRDVIDFLLKEGVDLNHNRFLILQGEVRNISLMKPMATNQNQDGFLEYIEDIIGSNKYIDDIKKSEVDLNTINEERDQAAERYTLSRRDLEALEDAKNEAKKYQELQERRKLLDAKSLRNNVEALQQKIATLDDEIKEFQNEINTKAERKNELEHADNGKSSEISEKENYLSKSLKPKIERSQEELSKLDNEMTRLNTEKEGINKTISDCDKKMKSAENDITACQNVIETNKQNIEEADNKINEAKVKLEIAQAKLEKTTQEVQKEIEALQSELQSKKQDYSSKYADFRQLDTQINQWKQEIDAINQKYEESKRRREENQRAIESINEKNINIEKEIENRQKLLIEVQEAIDYLDENIPVLEDYTNHAKEVAVEVNQMERQLGKKGKDRLFNCIKNFQERTNNTNIYGRLGELAHIDDEFNIPITAAAGNKLDYIVVETIDDANMCIEELRQKSAGYGNFIVLGEQEKHRPRIEALMNSRDPKQTCLILRKLKFDSEEERHKFITAFYFIFRETLVAENAEVARRVAYDDNNRRRVVDMDGIIIDISGTMNGGGDTKRIGGMQSFSMKDLEDKKKELEELDNMIKEGKREIVNRQNFLKRTNKDSLEVELQNLRYNYEQNQNQIENLQRQLSEIHDEKWTPEDRQKVSDNERYINQYSEELKNRKIMVDELDSECKRIENRISEIVSEKTRHEKEEINKIEKEIDKNNKARAQSEAAIKSATRKSEKSQKILNDNNKNKEEAENSLKELETKIEEMRGKKEKKDQEIKELSDEEMKLKNEIKELKEANSKSKEELDALDREIDELEYNMKNKTKELDKYKATEDELGRRYNELNIDQDEMESLEDLTDDKLDIERAAIDKQLNSMDPNFGVIREYEEKEAICKNHYDEFQEISRQRDEVLATCRSLKNQRLMEFTEGFNQIKDMVKETYQILTLGGDAELDLVDANDPFSQGIIFSVRPPGKSWKLISNLSGGEQTLSSLSLVFALHQYKPTPFYIMDEIDAALDKRNVAIIANYLKERTTNAQFIVVSLRNQMFELADKLVGIYKVSDCAKAITIGFDEENQD